MKNFSDAVFLDSSFLIAYQISGDDFHTKAKNILTDLYKKGIVLILNPLIMDEVWYVSRTLTRKKLAKPTEKNIQEALRIITEDTLAIRKLKIVNPVFKHQDIREVLSIMSKYDLRPRDALIVKSMQILGVNKIATFDTDFDRVKGINVIK
ncbi:MAG: type II toxin-antitoxin system VapC family toxin [Patescibacteria group bacterium]